MPEFNHDGVRRPARSTAPRPVAVVTLADVARAADVAVSTASRALANPERVSRATREHVQAVARRLGYQHLRSGTGQMLAMLISDVTNPFHFGLIRGAEAQARAAGYTLVIAEAQEDPAVEETHAARLGPVVDGLVLVASRLPDRRLAAITAARPCVLLNRELDGTSSVLTDPVQSSGQIVDHLMALGHRHLVYLAGPTASRADAARWSALAARAAEAGVRLDRLGPFLPTLDQGGAAADVGLASGGTALIAFNDLLAFGVLRRLGRRGVAVPGAISVVGHDDAFGADFCQPPLTTVSTPVDEAGRLLVDLLLGAVAGRPVRRITVPTYLKVRESTGPAAPLPR